ncbi:hypothetical protein [uncultured Hymenobacter sp.]|uniref:hypothetical protein n=1 Tax=uncultured Hymenobacter sp. TaxID=170016 RepID=UPI0035C9C24A
MVDIKHSSHGGGFVLDLWRRRSPGKRLRFAAAITQWLHNLALLSAYDFEGLREDWFWTGYIGFRKKFPVDRWTPHTEMIIRKLRKQQ